jgi:hypothetical protein
MSSNFQRPPIYFIYFIEPLLVSKSQFSFRPEPSSLERDGIRIIMEDQADLPRNLPEVDTVNVPLGAHSTVSAHTIDSSNWKGQSKPLVIMS